MSANEQICYPKLSNPTKSGRVFCNVCESAVSYSIILAWVLSRIISIALLPTSTQAVRTIHLHWCMREFCRVLLLDEYFNNYKTDNTKQIEIFNKVHGLSYSVRMRPTCWK